MGESWDGISEHVKENADFGILNSHVSIYRLSKYPNFNYKCLDVRVNWTRIMFYLSLLISL